MAAPTSELPQLTLYTNHGTAHRQLSAYRLAIDGCGWCHRVHIVLKELGLKYDEVLIELPAPRPDWYLKLNPRGLVPTLHVKTKDIDEYLIESGPIVEFLTELYPSHLTPNSGHRAADAVQHWRQRFFIDTWFSKINPLLFKMTGAADETSRSSIANSIADLIEKEIEPLLKDASPFFDGGSRLTIVEAMTMPFIILIFDFCDDVVWPAILLEKAKKLAAFGGWIKAGTNHESVLHLVARERRKKAVVDMLPVVRKKYAE